MLDKVVYDLVMKWAEVHYPRLEERRGVLETRLRHLIRFPYMTSLKLKEVTTGTYFSPEVASEIVLEALFFKNETPYGRHQLALGTHVADENIGNPSQRFVERAYTCRPVRAVVIEHPRYHCVAYLDLTREECMRLYPAGVTSSEDFHLGKHGFYLLAYCNMDLQNVSECFGLYLGMRENGSASCKMDYELGGWSKNQGVYRTDYKGSDTLTGGQYVGRRNLFNTTWKAFIADDSPFFTNGKLHLRATVYCVI